MTKPLKALEFTDNAMTSFRMADVSGKRITRRRAVAVGSIYMSPAAFRAVKNKTLPKGDALAMAEVSGIMGAKKTAEILPMCHPLPLDHVGIHFILNDKAHSITTYCHAVAEARTGVEMEALTGVQAALLSLWDLIKPVDPALKLGETRLLVKEGGKSGLWLHPDGVPEWLKEQFAASEDWKNISCAILVMSDRASSGVYEDKSGSLLKERLFSLGAEIVSYQVIPDDPAEIEKALRQLVKKEAPRLILASGGTGPGLRDATPGVLAQVLDCPLEGLGEMLRRESAAFTNTAWLSRMGGGLLKESLVIALPGSPKAVGECWEVLEPCLPKALTMIEKQGRKK